MAYVSSGLYVMANTGKKTLWALDTTDAIGTSGAAGYITDAVTKLAGKGLPGKGMKLGDTVIITVMDALENPTSVTDSGMYVVTGLNATTGAATLTAMGAT